MEPFDHNARDCAKLIQKANHIVVLSGAGISTNAGIPDFRGPKGLYITKQYNAEKIFDIGYFDRDPAPFFEFARDFIILESSLKPTFTHEFFAKLEKSGKISGIITQNIDALHQKAGSKQVFELHGSFEKSLCRSCSKPFLYEEMKFKIESEMVPACECGGVIKPDIVFFGEEVKYFSHAITLVEQSDLLFVVGTSCVVFPAAQLPYSAHGDIVLVNKGRVELDDLNISIRVSSDTDDFFKCVEFYL